MDIEPTNQDSRINIPPQTETALPFHVPIFLLENPDEPIDKNLLTEIERATLTTFNVLDIPTGKYRHGIQFADIVDPQIINSNNKHTFPRKNNSIQDMLAIIITNLPVYDKKDRELIAVGTDSNIALINLNKIDESFIKGDADKISLRVKVGVNVVEEVIHFVQRIWHGNEWMGDNTDSANDIDEHIKDKAEMEAAPLKKYICRILYPMLNLKIKGVDF